MGTEVAVYALPENTSGIEFLVWLLGGDSGRWLRAGLGVLSDTYSDQCGQRGCSGGLGTTYKQGD